MQSVLQNKRTLKEIGRKFSAWMLLHTTELHWKLEPKAEASLYFLEGEPASLYKDDIEFLKISLKKLHKTFYVSVESLHLKL